GETRDRETAKIAVEAALTGHLVFTTLHTNDAPGAITRLAEMEVDPYLVASASLGVIAQRLVRRVCKECTEEYVPDFNTLRYLGLLDNQQERLADSTIQYYRLKVNRAGMPIFKRGRGCEACNRTGYKNRIGVFEVMRINDEIRELISKGCSTAMIRLAAKQSGMIPLKDYSLRLVGEGLTTADEVVRVTLTDTSDDKLCNRCKNPISEDFIKCPFCQFDLKISCMRCGTLQEEQWASCPKCGLTKSEEATEFHCRVCGAEMVGAWHECQYCLHPKGAQEAVYPIKIERVKKKKPRQTSAAEEEIVFGRTRTHEHGAKSTTHTTDFAHHTCSDAHEPAHSAPETHSIQSPPTEAVYAPPSSAQPAWPPSDELAEESLSLDLVSEAGIESPPVSRQSGSVLVTQDLTPLFEAMRDNDVSNALNVNPMISAHGSASDLDDGDGESPSAMARSDGRKSKKRKKNRRN
ncbi:MAG: Flp pilus assembly complex ATPase component TadA, partial [Cyanobacteria bacterium]|nr:Flp pilus assembly complex ATPase component TadA [Cyanobacteriota bacterium]